VRRTWVGLMVLLALGLIAVGVYVLAMPEEARGADCGGSPLPVLVNGAGGEAAQRGLSSDCNESASESVALAFATIGVGVVSGVVALVLRP